MTNVYELPKGLPAPQDDGAAQHLKGKRLPNVSLVATNGKVIDIGKISDTIVIYCYPMTGQPNVPLQARAQQRVRKAQADLARARTFTPPS